MLCRPSVVPKQRGGRAVPGHILPVTEVAAGRPWSSVSRHLPAVAHGHDDYAAEYRPGSDKQEYDDRHTAIVPRPRPWLCRSARQPGQLPDLRRNPSTTGWLCHVRIVPLARTEPVCLADNAHDLGRIVHNVDQLWISGGDLACRQHGFGDPGAEALPVLAANQHYRKAGYLAGLHQGDGLEQLV